MRRQQQSSKDKKSWTAAEDNLLLSLVSTHGTSKWTSVSNGLVSFNRSGKQCRERYHNHLSPGVLKGQWSPEEDELIQSLQKKYGNAWAKITEHLPGRTDNAVKNRFWSSERSRIRRKGVALRRTTAPRMIKKDPESYDCKNVDMEDESILFQVQVVESEYSNPVVSPVLEATTTPMKIKVESDYFYLNSNPYSYVSSPSNASSSSSSDDEDEILILNDCDFFEGMDDSNLYGNNNDNEEVEKEGNPLSLQQSNSIVYFDDHERFVFGVGTLTV